MKLLFERSEYLARVARVKAAMAERGIDLLLVASPANQFWLTGYDGWSFYTPQIVALRIDVEEPIWVGRKMDAVGAKFTAFPKPDNVVPSPDIYVGSAQRHPTQCMAAAIAPCRRGNASSQATLKPGDLFYIEMGGVRHRYHSPLSRCFYLGKPSERMDKTAKVIAEGLAAVLDTVKPGVLCEELAATWTKVIARHGIEKDSRIGYPVGIGYPPT